MTVNICNWIFPTDMEGFAPADTADAIGTERREHLAAPEGVVDITRLTFPGGLQVVDFDGSLSADRTIPIRDRASYLSFAFVRSGTVVTRGSAKRFEFRAEPGTATMAYHGDFVGTATFEAPGRLRILSLCVPKTFLDAMVDRPFPGLVTVSPGFAYASIPQSPVIRQCVEAMADCPFNGAVRQLFLRAKAYEIITMAVAAISEARGDGLTDQDIARVHAARDILEKEIQDPPTVPELARMVGTNECRLKRDFKAALQTTPYAYVVARRMDIARAALMRGDCSITSVAQQVGYSNTSHFSAAFFKMHGLLPKDIKRFRMRML